MRGLQGNRTLFLAGVFVALVAVFAAMAPAYADYPQQGTLPAPTVVGPTVLATNVVPNTGSTSAGFPGWVLFAVLALIIVILLIALLARGSNRPIE